MIATFQALAVFLTTLLPGALFTLAFERENDRTATADFNERLFAFAATSAVFAVVSGPLLYQGYRVYVVPGRLKAGDPLPGGVWLIVLAYVLVPLIIGGYLGRKVKTRTGEGKGWKAKALRVIGGPLTGWKPDPRAWERLFYTPDLSGYVKIRLKEPGTGSPWILGVWAHPDQADNLKRPGSYVSGYPYDQDLYFYDTCEIDPDGTITSSDPAAVVPVKTGIACLINWSQVAYAEFIEA